MIALFLGLCFSSVDDSDLIRNLQKPKEIRKVYFTNKSKELKNIIDNERNPFQIRWRAYSTWVALSDRKKRILFGLKSSEWFFRDLALKLALKYDKDLALTWSKKLLQDPAMVVRTTAAKNLAAIKDQGSLEILWKELYSTKNFRKNQSLWVRKHLVKAISETYKGSDSNTWKQRFTKILKDKDESLHPFALYALSNSFPKGPISNRDEPLALQRQKWLAWAGE